MRNRTVFAVSLAASVFAFGQIGLTGDAKAQAMAPVLDWEGLYIGAHAGHGWGESRYQFGDGFSTGDFDVSGGLLGGTIGINWQRGAWVFGLEGDISWTDINGSTLCPSLVNNCRTGNTWLGTARGRIGYAHGRVLPYVTGGLAFGNIKADISSFDSSEGTETGWTVGAGIETALAPNWSAKLEYLYVDLGEFNCDAACSVILPGTDDFRTHIVRFGLNYKFNSGRLRAPLAAR